MYTTLAEVTHSDLATFLSVFATRGAALRKRHGSTGAEVLVGAEDPDSCVLVIDWESRARFEAFLADPEVPATMRSGGITAPPKFTPLARVASLPA